MMILLRLYSEADFIEVALQAPVVKGLLTLDFIESDDFTCVPKDLVDALFCETHNKIKPGWSEMLTAFHKYPRRISWREGKKWWGLNSFKGSKNYVGINFEFTCAHSKDKCQAQCKWSSQGIFSHDLGEHVLFAITF